jgi:hypothetical protein
LQAVVAEAVFMFEYVLSDDDLPREKDRLSVRPFIRLV